MSVDKYVHIFLDWLSSQNDIVIWLFFAFSNFLENVFPPWPGDTVTVFGGFMLGHGTISLEELATSTLAGNLAGGFVMFRFGRRFLHWMNHNDFPFKSSFYSQDQIHKTFAWFHRNSILVVILSRFSAGIRFFVSIVAGMSHMKAAYFFAYFTLAIFLWCGLLIYGGFYLGNNWEDVLVIVQSYNKAILFLIIAGVGSFLIFKFIKSTHKSEK